MCVHRLGEGMEILFLISEIGPCSCYISSFHMRLISVATADASPNAKKSPAYIEYRALAAVFMLWHKLGNLRSGFS